MKPTLVTKSNFKVIGIATRTTNALEMTADGKIGPLWGQFFENQVITKIPHQLGTGNLVGLYTDYENGADGEYTMVIGTEVSSFTEIPEGMLATEVPDSRYLVFNTKRGPVSQVVAEAWGQIWGWFMDSEYERAFTGDFEYYNSVSFNPEDAVVQIYIAIR